MKRSLPALLAFSLTVWATTAVSAPSDRRIALVIGNAAYDSFGRLANPGNDADDIAGVLRQVGFEVVDGRNLSRRDMDRKLAQFSRIAHDADTALVYYAGHGLQYQGQNYLVPTDAQLKDGFDVPFETIAVESVIGALDNAKGARILILDACRDLPLKDAGRRSGAAGLASVVGRKGLIMAYATQANSVAFDGTGRNSFYAAALVKTMAEPGLEVGQVFQRVALSVSTATNGRQLPEVTRSYPGEVFLNRTETDIQAWSRLRTSTQIADLRSFTVKYAGSFLRDDALARIRMLEEKGYVAAPVAADDARGREERRATDDQVAWARLEEEQRQREKVRLAADKARRDEEERQEQALILAQRREDERLAELARRAREEEVREAERQQVARLERQRRDEEAARTVEAERRELEQRTRLAMLATPKVEAPRTEAAPPAPEAPKPAAARPDLAADVPSGPAIAYASLTIKDEPAAATAALDEAAAAQQDRIVGAVQDRLQALGCYDGTIRSDGKSGASWNTQSMEALERFYRVTQAGDTRPGLTRAVKIVSHMPDQSTLDMLTGYHGRICPAACPTGTEPSGDACLRVSCPPGLEPSGDECRPATAPQHVSLPPATPRPAETLKPAAPAPKTAAPAAKEPRVKRAALPDPEPVKARPAVRETTRPVVKPKVTVVEPIRARARIPSLSRPVEARAPAPARAASSFGPAEIGAARMMSRMP
ncbi:caspase family protein [Methylobacterium oryzihabitans]|uniref:Caspase family protein n=1 Tax=Methylobacterium oryzihabitans TaxID=2499852 RepID=A0A3S2YML1_9HYPH|nr:caspase family protein [Methylobacterium oryzihabitans]RVU14952.1 caspase family protein [Methylobacterium oryzihabitans]